MCFLKLRNLIGTATIIFGPLIRRFLFPYMAYSHSLSLFLNEFLGTSHRIDVAYHFFYFGTFGFQKGW